MQIDQKLEITFYYYYYFVSIQTRNQTEKIANFLNILLTAPAGKLEEKYRCRWKLGSRKTAAVRSWKKKKKRLNCNF